MEISIRNSLISTEALSCDWHLLCRAAKGYIPRKYRIFLNITELARKAEERYGPFKWDDNDESKDLCAPKEMTDGFYIGQFDLSGARSGRGIFMGKH